MLFCISIQGVGSAINKLNDAIAMVAEVRNIAESLSTATDRNARYEEKIFKN